MRRSVSLVCFWMLAQGYQGMSHLCVSLSAAEEAMEIISRLCVGMMDVHLHLCFTGNLSELCCSHAHMALKRVTVTIMAFWSLWQFEWQCCIIVFVHWRYWYQINITPKHAATCPVMWITLADKILWASPHCTDCSIYWNCHRVKVLPIQMCVCVFAFVLVVGVCTHKVII